VTVASGPINGASDKSSNSSIISTTTVTILQQERKRKRYLAELDLAYMSD
jgi:hypothetical protein